MLAYVILIVCVALLFNSVHNITVPYFFIDRLLYVIFSLINKPTGFRIAIYTHVIIVVGVCTASVVGAKQQVSVGETSRAVAGNICGDGFEFAQIS